MSRRRGYGELQADGARGVVACPRCHELFVPLDAGAPAVPTRRIAMRPDGFPELSPAQVADRVRKLQPETSRLHAALRERVGDSTFELWLAPLRLIGAEADTLYALVPAELVTWVRDRFGRVLDAAATALAGRPVEVVVGGTA